MMSNDALTKARQSLQDSEKLLERALSAGQIRPDRLPGLQMIFGQLPRVLTEELGNLSILPVKVQLLELSASTIADSCGLQPGAFAGVVRAERWRSWLYFIADPEASLLFVEAATGCESIPGGGLPLRNPTRTDANILRVLFRRMARSLTAAFSILADVELDLGAVVEKIELEPQLSPHTPVVVARLGLDFDGHTGAVAIVIPQAALELIRHLLASASPNESLGSVTAAPASPDDPSWARQLADEISRAFINLDGVLEERTIALGEVQKFAVGSVIELQMTSMSRVRLDAADSPLFWCELGKREDTLILRVDDEYDQKRDAIDEYYGL